jgi:hypothetical protein
LANGELLARAAHDFEPWRPGGEGVALRLELPGISNKPVDLAAERDELPPELGSILRRRGPSRSRLARQSFFDQPAYRFGTPQPRARLAYDPTVQVA